MDSESSISHQLRVATQNQHRAAESSDFVENLLDGSLTLEAYTAYLINLAWVYEALEEQTSSGAPLPTTQPLWDDRLNRLRALTDDLTALGVDDFHTQAPTPQTLAYAEHLRALSGRADVRLVAHHYTRYLGDMSGGQAIGRLVERHYGATPEQLNFSRFDEIGDLVRYKQQYREHLDRLDLMAGQRKLLIDEACRAFDFARAMFLDLGVTFAPTGTHQGPITSTESRANQAESVTVK